MNLTDVVLLAVALAMDCFTVSIVGGVTWRNAESHPDWELPAPILRMALLFGFFQSLMPLLGWLGISSFSQSLQAVDHWIAFGLLAFVGGRMVVEALGPEKPEKHFDPAKLTTQLLLAVATSIDALAVGISFACTGYESLAQLALPLAIIGLASLLFSLLGYFLGQRFGRTIAHRLKPELCGGIILILIGIKILTTHLAETV